jgi:predicted nucleotide-binding protein
MSPHEELYLIAKKLASAAVVAETVEIAIPLAKLNDASNQVGKSFSGSWLGYHSRVYYSGLALPPPNANFSKEWGLRDGISSRLRSIGRWEQFDGDDVKKQIYDMAGRPDIEILKKASLASVKVFDTAKSEVISILQTETVNDSDSFLSKLMSDLDALIPMSAFDIAQNWSPKGQTVTRDMLAIGQGTQIPPHIQIGAEVASILQGFEISKEAAEICNKIASHLERKSRKAIAVARIGTNVFIGHGRSGMWRELKDFIDQRLSLPWDEFNRVPVAGITNITRLSEMLDAAAVALIVMTAEDELADGKVQARMNVIHEAGLFQGRLGFTKAIVLLEEGCEEFTNIQGLGQIRFAKGNVGSAFEEIRLVLEREGLIVER